MQTECIIRLHLRSGDRHESCRDCGMWDEAGKGKKKLELPKEKNPQTFVQK